MNKSNEVLEYLSNLSPKEKTVLGILRNQILDYVPNIEEKLSRGVPFFYHHGKRAVGFRSSKNHLSFFIMEGNVMKDLQNELTDFNISSTVVRFTAENPIPDELIKKLVLARIAEIEQTLSIRVKNDNRQTRTTTR